MQTHHLHFPDACMSSTFCIQLSQSSQLYTADCANYTEEETETHGELLPQGHRASKRRSLSVNPGSSDQGPRQNHHATQKDS